jgi:hypothetical protein
MPLCSIRVVGAWAQGAWGGLLEPDVAVANTLGSRLHRALGGAVSVRPVSTFTTRLRGRRTCGCELGRLRG